MRNNRTAKSICFVIIWILLVACIFTISIMQQTFNKTIKNVIGEFWFYLLYVLLPLLILGAPLLFKYITKCKGKKIILHSIALIIIYISIIYTTQIATYKYIQVFTTQKWLNYKYERTLMLDDLKNKYVLVGMQVDDIKKLLGNPDTESDNEIEYVINEGWIDPEMLVFRFEDQVIVEVYTYTEFKP